MESPDRPAASPGRWTSLWVVALVSFVAQLWLCQFFAQEPRTHAFGEMIPFSEDVNPSKLWTLAYVFPPVATFQVLNWLGVASTYLPQALNPLSLAAAWLPAWVFFTAYVPFISTMALLAMAAFLRELEISRPAALFGAIIYAWQGDILSFIYPGHYGYLTSWPFYALGAWGALRAHRTGHWPYAVISGVCCGLMVGLITNADRGGIASVLIAALYLAPLLRDRSSWRPVGHLLLCMAVAFLVALAPLLALFKGNIVGVSLGGTSTADETYKLVVQYSLGPAETLSYLAPGLFGWHSSSADARYWGWIGMWPDWPKNHAGPPNLNLAISTAGTIATLLAVIGALVVLPGRLFGAGRLNDRQRFYARVLLALGLVSLVLSWGQFIGPFYRALYDYLPLMDKWRNPLKWLEWFNFALMPLAAIGLDHLCGTLAAGPEAARPVRRRLLWFLSAVLLLLAGGLIASYALALPFATHFVAEGFDQPSIADMLSTMHVALIGAMLLTLLLGLVPFALWHADVLRRARVVNPWIQRRWVQMLRTENLPLTLSLALALLSTMQLGWVAQHFIQPWPIAWSTATNPLLDRLRAEGDRVRCTVAVEDPTLNFLLQNQFAAMDISCLDISAASRYPKDYDTFLHLFDNNHAALWFLAGVRNVVIPEAGVNDLRSHPEVATNIDRIDGYTIAPTPSPDVPSHALITMKDCLEKATLVPGDEVLAQDDLFKRLVDPKWNPRATVLLSLAGKDETSPLDDGMLASAGDLTFPPAPATPASADSVTVKTYSPTKIELAVESTQNAFVLVNDYFDPDWEVQVNGHAVPLLRGDYVLRAVAVPAGTSTVTMRYVAHYLGLPAVVVCLFSDGVMLAAWIVAGVALWRKP